MLDLRMGTPISFRHFVAAGFLACIFSAGCKKQEPSLEDQLPSVTTDGRMEFACILNDESVYNVTGQYESGAMAIGSNCTSGSSVYADGLGRVERLHIYSATCKEPRWRFEIDIRDSVQVGTYSFGEGSAHTCYIRRDYGGGAMDQYRTEIGGTGTIQFLRADDSVFAGTFSFEFNDGTTNRRLSVREGRFDLRVD